MAKKNLSNDHPIDQLFREGLNKREFVYDESYWEGAQKTLAEFNRAADKRRYGWWFGGAAALLVITTTFIVLQFGDKADSSAVQQPLAQTKELSAPATVPSTQDAATEAITNSTTTKSNTSEQNSTSFIQKKINKRKKQIFDTHKSAASEQQQSNSNSNLSSANLTDNNADNTAATATNSDASQDAKPQNEAEVATVQDKVINDEIRDTPDDTVYIDPSLAIATAITQGGLPPKIVGTPRYQWYVGMYAGSQTSYPNFRSGPGLWPTYLEQQETSAFSPVVSLETGIKFNKLPVDFNLGATFMQMGEDALFAVTSTLLDTAFDVTVDSLLLVDSTYIDTAWVYTYDWMYINDTAYIISSTDTTVVRKASNRLYYVEIPMLIGYSLRYNNWQFRLSTGPSIGFLRNRAGYYPNDDFSGYNALEETQYFNRTVWYWRAEPTVGYYISPNVLLQCRGTFRVQLSDTYNADDRSLRYWTHGLQVGLRYTFTSK